MKQPGFHAVIWMAGMVLFVLSSGCGKTTSSSVQDQGLVSGEAKSQPDQPKVAEPEQKTEKQAETVAPPGPPEERVTEPTVAIREREQPASDVREQPAAAPPVQFDLSDVFFDFDRAVIRGDAKPVLEANARSLKAEAGKRIVVEGHCDERGTLEYNLVLGEKRARAVEQYLTDLGVPPSSMRVASFGKEKPVCTEHNQTCWQKNRRAHFLPQ